MKIEVGALILGMLGILFIGLKLTNNIVWSWLWVLTPFWAPVILWISFVVAVQFITATAIAIENWRTTRRNRKHYGF